MSTNYISVPKREDEEIRVQWNVYEGHTYLDVRIHFRDGEGDWHPTKKGITVSPDGAEELFQAIEQVVRGKGEEKKSGKKTTAKRTKRVKAKVVRRGED